MIDFGIEAAVMQMNADGTCPRVVLGPDLVGVYGASWQPGAGREAGRIDC